MDLVLNNEMMTQILALKNIWQQLCPSDTTLTCFNDVIQRYQQPWRYYHTVQHLYECLMLWQRYAEQMKFPQLVGLALFYHDVVYDPKAKDNEQQSAKIAVQHLSGKMMANELALIEQWILVTQHHQQPYGSDSPYAVDVALLLDIDLAILGSEPSRFAEYERQIQQEYAWVEPHIYQQKRQQVLASFYQRTPLYLTAIVEQDREVQAKHNLAKQLLYSVV